MQSGLIREESDFLLPKLKFRYLIFFNIYKSFYELSLYLASHLNGSLTHGNRTSCLIYETTDMKDISSDLFRCSYTHTWM